MPASQPEPITTRKDNSTMTHERLPDDFDPNTYEGDGSILSTIGVAMLVEKRGYAPIPEDTPVRVAQWFIDKYDGNEIVNEAMILATSMIFAKRYPWAHINDTIDETDKVGDENGLVSGFPSWRRGMEAEIVAMQKFVDTYGDYFIVEPATREELDEMAEFVLKMQKEHEEQRAEQEAAVQRLLALVAENKTAE